MYLAPSNVYVWKFPQDSVHEPIPSHFQDTYKGK